MRSGRFLHHFPAWASLLLALAGLLPHGAHAQEGSGWCLNGGGYGLWEWRCTAQGCAAHPGRVLTNTVEGMAEVAGDIFSLRLEAGRQPVFTLVPPGKAMAHEVSVATVSAPIARTLRGESGFRVDDEENVASITQALIAGQPLVLKFFDIQRATQTAAVEILPQGFVQTINEAMRWVTFIDAEREDGREACIDAAIDQPPVLPPDAEGPDQDSVPE